MDINSLLSPQSQPSRNPPTHSLLQPPQQPGKKRYRPDGKRTASSLSNEVILSPPADPPRSTPAEDVRQQQNLKTLLDGQRSGSGSPYGGPHLQSSRHQSPIPQLAHQELRSSPALTTARIATPPYQRIYSASDLVMAEAPAQTPAPRAYSTASMTAQDLETVTQLTSDLAKNSYDYNSHVQLINLLHQGFKSHLATDLDANPDPAEYTLLADLRQAREAMDSRFAVGEDIWKNWIQDESLLAKVSEDRNTVMELCAKAVQEEPTSVALWSLYGEWVWTTHGIANALVDDADAIMTEDDRLVCKEIFTRDLVLSVWRDAVAATRWCIDASHLIWNRYAQIIMQDFPDAPPRETLEEGRSLYMMRLQFPHADWDHTLQTMFWPFVSKYYPNEWEDIIAATKEQAVAALQAYSLRESYESRLEAAVTSGDQNELYAAFASYLTWEAKHKQKSTTFEDDLRCALFERALLRFPTMIEWWLDYIEYRISNARDRERLLPLLERATRHCPWSGELWSRRMLQAEIEGRRFNDHETKTYNEIESVNLKASNCGLLEAGGMDEMLNVHATWCNYLRRRAFGPHSTEDGFDMAEFGISQVIEGVQDTIRKFIGKEFKGDPSWRMEKIYIEFLTRARRLKDARAVWESLIAAHCHSYDFWTRYYNWEMTVWTTERALSGVQADTSSSDPALACEVIKLAFKQDNLDWPEKLHEMYAYHYRTHHSPEDIQQAEIDVRASEKHVKRRREREALEVAAQAAQADVVSTPEASRVPKRKRSDESEAHDDDATKRNKVEEAVTNDQSSVSEAVRLAKRDREHNTASVRGLPSQVTEKRIRQFFSDCGRIVSVAIRLEPDESSASCTIEFESHDDVLSARTRDGKELDGHHIRVNSGAMSTLYVAGYPAEYDEAQVRQLFERYGTIVSVRFPSLKFNSRRRFCYVQFLTDDEARAATEMDHKAIDTSHTLLAKISDPNFKTARSGALAEQREVRIGNIDFSTTEDEVRALVKEFGTIESLRMLKATNGKFKGTAFVAFTSTDAAVDAVALDHKPFKGRILNVCLATDKAAREGGDHEHKPSTRIVEYVGSTQQIGAEDTSRTVHERTVALLDVPDTVTDARIEAFLKPHGRLIKIKSYRTKGGVLAEFVDIADAGKVGLGIDCSSLGPYCRIGDPAELLGRSAKPDKPIKSTVTTMRPAQAGFSRPAQRGQSKRGGLGFKSRGAERLNGPIVHHEIDETAGGRNNAEFRAMFVKASEGTEAKVAAEDSTAEETRAGS